LRAEAAACAATMPAPPTKSLFSIGVHDDCRSVLRHPEGIRTDIFIDDQVTHDNDLSDLQTRRDSGQIGNPEAVARSDSPAGCE